MGAGSAGSGVFSMFLARVLSTILAALFITGLAILEFYPGIFLVITLLGLLAQWEFYTMQEAKGLKVFKKAGITAGAVFYFVVYLQAISAFDQTQRFWAAMETLVILAALIGFLTRQIFEKNQQTPVATVALTAFGFFYVPFLFQFMLRIVFETGGGERTGLLLVVFLIIVTKSTDIGAYLIGSLCGRHKMSPRISPKKTWEGFVGGVLTALGFSLLLGWWFDVTLPWLGGFHALMLGILLPVTSVVGDLAESVIKRDSQSKDSGGTIPGIGGSLDLIDSLLFTAPLFYSYLMLFSPL